MSGSILISIGVYWPVCLFVGPLARWFICMRAVCMGELHKRASSVCVCVCVWCGVVVCGALVRMSVWVSVYVIHAHGAIWCIYVTSHVEKGIKECLQTLTVSAL